VADARPYLDYPPSKTLPPVWLPDRRPDWGNSYLAEVLDPAVYKAIMGCSTEWETLKHKDTEARKVRNSSFCHERLFCGVCSASEANERASTLLEDFRAINVALKPSVAAIWIVFTIPTS